MSYLTMFFQFGLVSLTHKLLRDPQSRRIVIYTFVFVLISSLFYTSIEGWSFLDSIYFVIMTITTIGFGDFVPTEPISKLYTMFVALNGIALLLVFLEELQRVHRTAIVHDIEPPQEG